MTTILENPNDLSKHRALVLNADFRPISVAPLHTLSWRESIEAKISDSHIIIEEYDVCVRSARDTFTIPSVVAIKEYLDMTVPAAKTRFNIMLAHGFRCVYCGPRFRVEDLTFDHVIPKSKGGPGSFDNLVPSCRDCNSKKADRTPKQAGMPLLSEPYHPSRAKLNSLALQFVTQKKDLHKSWIDYIYWGSSLE